MEMGAHGCRGGEELFLLLVHLPEQLYHSEAYAAPAFAFVSAFGQWVEVLPFPDLSCFNFKRQ